MTRIPQKQGIRGSLKWIQRAVNDRPELLDAELLKHLHARRIEWRSPLRADSYAEYRDGGFLNRIARLDLAPKLTAFWPARGPQWDALGTSDAGDVLLVEAKAHVEELCSPATSASPTSRKQIERALAATIKTCRAQPRVAWTELFYQLGNRIAHLKFLRDAGVKAWLVLVNFTGDHEMNGPNARAEWEAAYTVVYHAMGLDKRNPLGKYVIHLYPSVSELSDQPTPHADDSDDAKLQHQLEIGRKVMREHREALRMLAKL